MNQENQPQTSYELNLCWILDITGSMSNELQACKQSILSTIKKVEETSLPVKFSLITYWDGQTSVVDCYTFQNSAHAEQIINPIVVIGGMGDENAKHGLAKFIEYNDFSIPTIAFFMTDAGYHEEAGAMHQYIVHEKQMIEAMNMEFDIFKIWEKCPKEKLFFFPTTLKTGCLSDLHRHDFGQLAEQSNGVYLQIEQRDARVISAGMVKVIENILDRLCGETEEEITLLDGFSIFDTSLIIPRISETEQRQGSFCLLPQTEFARYMSTKMEKLITIVGEGWSKRKITLNPECLSWQMKLVAYCIKYFSGDDEVKPKIETCLQKIKETIPEEQSRFLSVSLRSIEDLREQVRTLPLIFRLYSTKTQTKLQT